MQAILLTPELESSRMGRPSQRPRSDYGKKLVALREAAGLTQQQLADQVGVDQSNIAFWERWGKAPRGEVLPKMAQALGVTVDELLGVAPPKRRVAKGQLQEAFQEARACHVASSRRSPSSCACSSRKTPTPTATPDFPFSRFPWGRGGAARQRRPPPLLASCNNCIEHRTVDTRGTTASGPQTQPPGAAAAAKGKGD